MNFEVFDNFLPRDEFENIQSIMMDTYFPWYWNDWTIKSDDDKPQLTHTFHALSPPWNGRKSDYYPLFDNIQVKLGVKKLYRIKSNLTYKTFFNKKAGYHIDTLNKKTAILYVNTNNGGTKFKNGKFVKSLENRVVVFDSNMEHTGVTCTNQQRRIVINFNYL